MSRWDRDYGSLAANLPLHTPTLLHATQVGTKLTRMQGKVGHGGGGVGGDGILGWEEWQEEAANSFSACGALLFTQREKI